MDGQKLTVRAVERALDVLSCFTASDTDLSLTDIAARVQLHKSTVHRLLASLESKEYIVRDPGTEKYRLGFRIWELAANLARGDEPAQILLPEMEKLRDQVGETISLYVRDGLERIRIQAVQSNQSIRRVAPVGVRLPIAVGASSKVLIAFAEPQLRQSILDQLTWSNEKEPQLFLQQLDEIYKAGYATSMEERESGAAAVAAPIMNRAHKIVAALSVSGPSSRLDAQKMKEIAPQIMSAAKRMGTMLG
ncbi:MAG: IclR family transcriptional regulator [Paenibacillus sp. RIFOXYA1_FULL_44_5]|nr:MAG: IclR family transcriptional regulator [Paenibacillus sp. RIFOXYA1_FULL_44_5]